MTAYLLANHLINLLAPAVLIALMLALSSQFFRQKQPLPNVWWVQAAINFVVGSAVLAAGLVLLGRDGKMLTYLLLALAMAASQGWQVSGWKK